jgi:hypothetical protein
VLGLLVLLVLGLLVGLEPLVLVQRKPPERAL